MKKMKKIFAVLLTLAMVLGMSITTFAAGNAEITVDGLPTDRTITLQYVQVIKADQTTSTGWAFTSNAIQRIYINAFKAEVGDVTDRNSAAAQSVIKELIRIEKGEVAGTNGTNSAEIAQALSDVRNSTEVTFESMETPQTVTEAGVYAIVAIENTPEGEKQKYTFNTMAAYVGFGEVKDDDGEVISGYPTLLDTTINAKKSEISFDKTENDKDDVVGIGDIVDYTIKVNVPYVEAGRPLEEKTFVVRDTLTGGVYVSLDTATIDMGGTDLKSTAEGGYGVTIEANETNTSFEIDLGDLINTANTNAGKEIVISYKVKITGTEVIDNKAYAGHESDEYDDAKYGSDEEKLYTGTITVTKTDDANKKLANAGFEVTINNNTVYFTKKSDGVYDRIKAEDVPEDVKAALDKAADDKKTAKNDLEVTKEGVTYVRQVFTDANGEIKLNGLDVGTYKITEKTAPEGYSINENIEDVVLEISEEDGTAEIEEGTGNLVAIDNISGERLVKDTKLSALPSTGGIGTTIFTIGGCAIIIVAAGLFFASRRKSAK